MRLRMTKRVTTRTVDENVKSVVATLARAHIRAAVCVDVEIRLSRIVRGIEIVPPESVPRRVTRLDAVHVIGEAQRARRFVGRIVIAAVAIRLGT